MDDVDYGTDEEEDEEEDEEDPYGMMEGGEGAAAGGSGKGRGRGAAAMEDDGDEAPELEPIADDDDAGACVRARRAGKRGPGQRATGRLQTRRFSSRLEYPEHCARSCTHHSRPRPSSCCCLAVRP